MTACSNALTHKISPHCILGTGPVYHYASVYVSADVEYKSARIGSNCIHMYTIASEYTLATTVHSVKINLAIYIIILMVVLLVAMPLWCFSAYISLHVQVWTASIIFHSKVV